MSKTKGNVVDPLGVIDESGADALRFALIHGATPGNDQGSARQARARPELREQALERDPVRGRGAADDDRRGAARRLPEARDLGPAERWLRSRAAATIAAADAAMAVYPFAEVTRVLYDAIWSEYCDWGLEFAKVRLADRPRDATREATWWTLVDALDTYLRLLHPVMPFVTEALWSALPHRGQTRRSSSSPAGPPPGTGRDREHDLGELIDLIRVPTRAPRRSCRPPTGSRPWCSCRSASAARSRRSGLRSSAWRARARSTAS